MDFTKPQAQTAAASAPFKASNSRFYKPEVAATLFKSVGREDRFTAGQKVFVEDEKASKGGLFSRNATRMFYLAEGEVALTIGERPLDVVKAGEVFGEMAVISGRPRSATATARIDCVAYSLDAPELQAALARNPEFALMLASVMFDRLRFIAARLASRPRAAGVAPMEAKFFEPHMVAELQEALPKSAIVRFPQQTLIFREGQSGSFMYVVKAGKVGIAVGATIVEVVVPGGTFGEMAVVDQSPRTARAGAIDECELLAIDRASLLHVIEVNPAFAMALLKAVAERLRHMNNQLQ
ncbi:MAG TPA: cyclic nucleotide-binding domain-containing protein [Usitatibacter sp.]|nr:cyclic nucleotide-binding domain-containing protein [Usitatibacter sp.]